MGPRDEQRGCGFLIFTIHVGAPRNGGSSLVEIAAAQGILQLLIRIAYRRGLFGKQSGVTLVLLFVANSLSRP